MWAKTYRFSPERVTLAYVVPLLPMAAPGVSPQSKPAPPASEHVRPEPGSHWRPMSSASPPYSPAPSWASTVGALAAAGTVVLGRMPMVRSSNPVPPLLYVVVMRMLTLVFCGFGAAALTGSVELVNELETEKSTVASAPEASGP